MADASQLAQNRLLASLDGGLAAIAPDFEAVSLGVRDSIYGQNEPIDHVLFPTSGVYSMVSEMEDGRGVEVATVGNEGMLGLPVFLQGALTSSHHAFCQVPGDALRMPAARFDEIVTGGELPELQTALRRYTQALMSMIARAVACNGVHSVEQRACRWLLQTHDRVGRDEFLLTQEFLGQMLGVSRASVNEVARELQRQETIDYARGRVSIVDRARLESCACECYFVVRDEYERLLGPGA
ncbi:MAG TPA: Crp/Fnr family transcriptional regulator [Thermoleophilaceae bacterium]